ncbi:hypothetical protein S40288_08163 [Stachybotrys chartarum IBT 40288]|nr:hypothetical protein S40288_08163 [Stachybotrys chartarum IBT 40288]
MSSFADSFWEDPLDDELSQLWKGAPIIRPKAHLHARFTHVNAFASPAPTESDSSANDSPKRGKARGVGDQLKPPAPEPVPSPPTPTSGRLQVLLPVSTLLTPRSQYEPFEPDCPLLSERSALELLRGAGAQDGNGDIVLEDFAVYCDAAHSPLEMRSLHQLYTKIGHHSYFFDGVLRSGHTRAFVRRVPIHSLPIGNHCSVSEHSIGSEIWIQSAFNSKTDLYYRLGRPALEYARFYKPFLWVADLAKHFVDFLAVMQERKQRVTIQHFRTDFASWLRETHGSAPVFVAWKAQHPSQDFCTSIVANASFLHKEAVGVLGEQYTHYHRIWRDIWTSHRPHPSVEVAPTVVTPYIFDCFRRLPFGQQLAPLALSQKTHGLRREVIQQHRHRFPKSRSTHQTTVPGARMIAVGDTISTPRDTETTGTLWQREVAASFDDVDRWLALVLKITHDARGKRVFDVIWYYRPVDTLCGLMKYPWDNELFLSNHCSCEERSKITEDEVIAVHNVHFGGNHNTDAEFFCRQTYLSEDRSWVSLEESHLFCKHVRPLAPRYHPGDTLLVRVELDSDLSEPCELVSSFGTGRETIWQLRRLLRRRDADPTARHTRPNELVYTQEMIRVATTQLQGPCTVRFFPATDKIPTPYDRDGVGNFFYFTHHRVWQAGRSYVYLPLEACPESLRQGFNPKDDSAKLRGLDLFCGGGNFGRGLEDGGAIEMKWANDYDSTALQTYVANIPDPESFGAYLGSIDDLQRLAIQGQWSKKVPRVGDVDFISGGSPCPGFSNLTNDKTTIKQRKNQSLVAAFASFVDLYRPKYALLENVAGIVQGKANRDQDVFSQLICAMVGLGYQTSFFYLDASSCGSSQRRTRVFLAVAAPGYKLPRKPPQTHSTPPYTTKSALGKLPNGQAMAERELASVTPFRFVNAAEATADLPPLYDAKPDICVPFPDHRVAVGMTKLVRSRLAQIPMRPYGINFATAWYGVDRNAPGSGVMTAAERALFSYGKSFNTSRISNAYGRQDPRRLLETVVTSPHPEDAKSGRHLHWSEPRVMSLMEARRAQGFRDHEVILGLPRQQWRIVGNSVAREVALSLGAVFQAAWTESQELHRRDDRIHDNNDDDDDDDLCEEEPEGITMSEAESTPHVVSHSGTKRSIIVEIRSTKKLKVSAGIDSVVSTSTTPG